MLPEEFQYNASPKIITLSVFQQQETSRQQKGFARKHKSAELLVRREAEKRFCVPKAEAHTEKLLEERDFSKVLLLNALL